MSARMRLQLQRYGKFAVVILVLMAVATLVGLYILVQQRLPTPFEDRYTVKAELTTSTGLNAGLGLPVNVAGVKVGTIAGAELDDGRSVVELSIDRTKLPHVYRDATARMVPNTPLKDMQIELLPGTKDAGELSEDDPIPVQSTSVPVDSDEILNALDGDTREFFEVLVSGLAGGLDDRGEDLRAIFEQLAPTAEQLRTLGDALVDRRRQLRRLVHNLAELARDTEDEDDELAGLIVGANSTLQALASQESALRAAIAKLPGTLSRTRSTLVGATGFANELGPTLAALTPATRRLPAVFNDVADLDLEPLLKNRLRPLVRLLQPVARDLAPTTRDLSAVTPALHSAFQVLNYTVNELAYNPPGDNEGFLFWTSWFAHNVVSVLSTEDAHGAVVRGLTLVDCRTIIDQPALAPLLEAVVGSQC